MKTKAFLPELADKISVALSIYLKTRDTFPNFAASAITDDVIIPLVKEELKTIIAEAFEAGCKRSDLYTGGTELTKEEYISSLLQLDK